MSVGAPSRPQRLEPQLRDELLALTERDFGVADALEERAADDPVFGGALDALLGDAATPFVAGLARWADAPEAARRLIEVTGENLERLAELVAENGWPGLTRVGALGADAAWIVAAHGDAANALRRPLIDALRTAVDAGEADPRHYATLVDRVAAVDGEPQTFGTIIADDDGVAAFPVPITDPDGLAARRAALGLPPVSDELPYLTHGDLIPFGPDRRRSPLLAWPTVLEGHRSVEAALAAGVRTVHMVLAVRPRDRRLRRLNALAEQRGAPIRAVEPDVVDELTSGVTHGGVAAITGPRRYLALGELLARTGASPLLVMLDGIEDPYNLGQAVRALYAAGVDGLVIGQRSWEAATAIVTRAAAGTSELLPTATVDGVAEAAAACRAAGLQVACATRARGARGLAEVDLAGPTLLIVGGERRGIRRSFVESCDVELAIPYGRPDGPPLGAAAAATILAFEALRQRRAE